MNELHRVALWSMVGESDPTLLRDTLRVLRYLDGLLQWRGKILFSVLDPATCPVTVPSLRVIQIPTITDRGRWEIMVGKLFPAILEEYEFSLSIHDDGYPIELQMWDDAFLNYDWIGAPWNFTGLVGSGGCCLTSSNMMNAMTRLPWYDGRENVDEWICKTHREQLINNNLRFAPPEVAVRFATECTDHNQPSFAFHGRAHAVEKHKQGWSQIEAFEKENGFA